jgi:hypothetical protein
MTANTTCAGCTNPAGPFACAVNGIHMSLCSTCAARLMKGESKADVIRTTTDKQSKKAA